MFIHSDLTTNLTDVASTTSPLSAVKDRKSLLEDLLFAMSYAQEYSCFKFVKFKKIFGQRN